MSNSDTPQAASPRRGRMVVLDTLLVAAAQLLTKLRALITVPVIAGRLGAEGYGIWAQTLALIAALGPVLGLVLHQPVIRFGAARRERAPGLFSTALALTMLGATVAVAVALLRGDWLAWLFYGDAGLERFVLYALGLTLCANLRALVAAAFRITGAPWASTLQQLGVTIVGLGALAWSILSASEGERSLERALGAMLLAEAVATMLAMFAGAARIGVAWPSRDEARAALGYSLPMVPSVLAAWFMDRVDRLILGHFSGQAAVGVYSAQYAMASVVLMVPAALQVTIFPQVSALWDAEPDRARGYLRRSAEVFVVLCAPSLVLVPLLGDEVLTVLGGRSVASSDPWLLGSIVLGIDLWGLSMIQVLALHGQKNTRAIARINATGAVVNLVLNLALVPAFGVRGAGLATAGAYAYVCVVQALATNDDLPLRALDRTLATCLAISAALALPLATLTLDGPLELAFALVGYLAVYGALALRFGPIPRAELIALVRRRARS